MSEIEKRTTSTSLDQIFLNLEAIKKNDSAIQAYSAHGRIIPGSAKKVLV